MSELKITDAANYWEAQYGKVVELNFKQAATIADRQREQAATISDLQDIVAELKEEVIDLQSEQAATINRGLTEAAQAVVDAGIIPPMGDHYYSESDSEVTGVSIVNTGLLHGFCHLIAQQAATIERLTEAAQAVVDAGMIPPKGDYYYSESDSELMDALAKALEQTP